MITIFLRFLAKKIGVFLKNQCYDQNFAQFSFVLSKKRQYFRRIIRQKYFKNHNIGPWCPKLQVLVKCLQMADAFIYQNLHKQ
jgi:hypothetical protein